MPPAEMVHWWFATGFLFLGLLLLTEAVVGADVLAQRPWRRYLWPGVLFGVGLLLWPVMTFFTKSTIHMLAHGSWAQVVMVAGAVELGMAHGKLKSQYWRLALALALLVSGAAFLVHEQHAWLYSRAAFLHHALGWTILGASVFPLVQAFRPRSTAAAMGFAMTLLVTAALLFCDRDTAAIFGHLSQNAGIPHR